MGLSEQSYNVNDETYIALHDSDTFTTKIDNSATVEITSVDKAKGIFKGKFTGTCKIDSNPTGTAYPLEGDFCVKVTTSE